MYEANAPKARSGVSCWMFAMLSLAVSPDVLDRVVAGRVRRQENRGDGLRQLAGPVEAGQGFGVVEPGIVQHDSDLVGASSALEPFQSRDDLLGVLIPLDRIKPHSLVSQGQGAEERLGHFLPVRVGLGALALGQPHAAGPGPVLQAHPVDRARLPDGVRQVLDLGFHFGHAPGDGLFVLFVAVFVERVGQFGTRPAEPQEQLVGGVGSVLDIEQDLHHVMQGRNIPELCIDPGSGGWPGRNSLEVFLLGAGEFRGVLVPRMLGQHRAHPRVLPAGEPLPNSFRAALDHVGDNTHIDTTRSMQNGFGLHPHQYVIVCAFLPSDQDSGFSWSGLDPHALIISETRP